MYKVKRTIYVKGQAIEIWLGLLSKAKNGKNGRYTVYLLTDNPNKPLNHADPLISGITSKETALRKGIECAKRIFEGILSRQQETEETEKEHTDE